MEKLVVIGNGKAGVACLEQILKHRHDFDITVFGDETHVNYNRIMLSSVLAGECDAEDIVINGLEWYQSNGISLRMGVRIVDFDSEYQTVVSGASVVCPLHGWRISLDTGAVMKPELGQSVRTYPVMVEHGIVCLQLPHEARKERAA